MPSKAKRKAPTKAIVKWVNVEERLPDSIRRVLVYEALTAETGRVYIGWYEPEPKQWYYDKNTDYSGAISHWQELPKRP